jgi:hypothetical protein
VGQLLLACMLALGRLKLQVPNGPCVASVSNATICAECYQDKMCAHKRTNSTVEQPSINQNHSQIQGNSI